MKKVDLFDCFKIWFWSNFDLLDFQNGEVNNLEMLDFQSSQV